MFILGVFIFYILILICAIIISIKSLIVSLVLMYFINKNFSEKLMLLFNYDIFNYYLFLSLIFFFFFTTFFGIFVETKQKYTQMDKGALFSVALSWILLLYGRIEQHMLISFVAVNCLNFSAIKLYFSEKTEKGHAIYFLFGMYSLVCGWIFSGIFIYEFYSKLNKFWISSMIVLTIYYFITYIKSAFKAFFR